MVFVGEAYSSKLEVYTDTRGDPFKEGISFAYQDDVDARSVNAFVIEQDARELAVFLSNTFLDQSPGDATSPLDLNAGLQSILDYMDEFAGDADLQVVNGEIGELLLRAKGLYHQTDGALISKEPYVNPFKSKQCQNPGVEINTSIQRLADKLKKTK